MLVIDQMGSQSSNSIFILPSGQFGAIGTYAKPAFVKARIVKTKSIPGWNLRATM